MDKALYTVGDLCALTGVTRKTLFYYDKINLLNATTVKGRQNQKMYDSAKLQRLQLILRYRSAGLTIREIRQLLECSKEESVLIFKNALKQLENEMEQRQCCIAALNELIEEYSRP